MARERITALLWPEADAERARHSLEQVIYVLRRALGPDALTAAGSALALAAGAVSSDVEELGEAVSAGEWEAAVALYGGAFLDGFHLSGAAEFEHWLDGARAELHECYTGALRRLAGVQATASDRRGAVATWRRLAVAEPLSAPVVLGLMRALAAAGDGAAAITAARVHATLLRDELDASPDPAVVALSEQLRDRPAARASPGVPSVDATMSIERGGAAASAESPTTAGPEVRRRTSVGAVAIAGALFAALVGVAFALGELPFTPERTDAAGPAPATASLPRVEVEEFASEAGDSVPEYAGRMAGDWIRQGLARTGLVEVAPAPNGDAAPERDDDVSIAGRVYRVGDDLWFQAWISKPAAGALLSTMDPVHAPLGDPVAALEPLRQQVLGAAGILFDPRLSDWAGAALRPPTFDAYRAFVQGLEAFSSSALPSAVAHFRRAAMLDPAYAQPRLWGAWTCIRMGAPACADSLSRAVEPLAGSLTPLEQAWHDRITALLRGDSEASFRAAQRMMALSPGSGWAMALHNAAMHTRRARLAAVTLREAGPDALGLVGVYYWGYLAEAHHALGEYDISLDVAEAGVRSGNHRRETLAALAAALAALGDSARLVTVLAEASAQPGLSEGELADIVFTAGVELRAHGNAQAAQPLLDQAADRYLAARRPAGRLLAALHEAERWDELDRLAGTPGLEMGDVDRLGIRGHAAARRGDRAAAARIGSDLAALEQPFLFGAHTLWRARIAAELGDPDQAVALLRQAFSEGASAREWRFLHYGRDFARMRNHPGFRDLVRSRD